MRDQIAKYYVLTYIALGSAAFIFGLVNWETHDPLRFLSFVAAAALGSALKVRLPGVTGTMSVSSLFVLVGIVNLSLPESLVVGAVSLLVQSVWHTKSKPRLVHVLFNVCGAGVAIYVTTEMFRYTHSHAVEIVSLAVLACMYFVANTFPVACVIGLTERKDIIPVWKEYRWMLPYYAVGCSMAWVIGTVPKSIQWELPIICLPLVYLVHRSNRTQIQQVEQQSKHIADMNALHLRTIEALALAIDAKDHNTHDHLQRVQLYAMEIGKDLGLAESELDALRAASTLHDIGKLAVPESIISKPGKLTRAEFDKMKIHPVVGAEILERVNFPYPVVPIVRAHHEKWDGSGYPYGLKGTEIPVGARILAAVDCLDALASDRQYRRALPLDEAMAKVASEAGTSFDPNVVNALQKRYQELEARAKTASTEGPAPLSVDIKITRGGAPAAGFEADAPKPKHSAQSPMHPVARARILRASEAKGGLRAHEALAVAALRVQDVIDYDAIAFCACEEGRVKPKFVMGEDRRLLTSLSVREGEGLLGWVAETSKPILNGNPTVEPGYSDGRLTSALALPLEAEGQVVGVLAVYRKEKDAFGADELVALLPLCGDVTSILLDMVQSSRELLGNGKVTPIAQSA